MSRRGAAAGALLLMALSAGCGSPGWNVLRRERAAAREGALDRELERHRRAVDQAAIAIDDAKQQLGELELQHAEQRAEVRVKAAELDRELATLAALEEDLTAARQRQTRIREALAAVRQLEEELAGREARLRELTAELAAVETQSAAKRAELEQAEAQAQQELAAREAEAQQAIAVLQERAAALTPALEALRGALEASAGLFPPATPPPTAEPGDGGEPGAAEPGAGAKAAHEGGAKEQKKGG